MKTQFQAKDIQKMLDVPKHRYEYIASKIGVYPEILEADGRGYTHFYSFKNAVQFAIVHYANLRGLSPKGCRELLVILNDDCYSEVYEPETEKIELWVHVIYVEGKERFAFTGTSDFVDLTDVCVRRGSEIDELYEPEDEETDMGPKVEAEAYLTINIGAIKTRVLRYSATAT